MEEQQASTGHTVQAHIFECAPPEHHADRPAAASLFAPHSLAWPVVHLLHRRSTDRTFLSLFLPLLRGRLLTPSKNNSPRPTTPSRVKSLKHKPAQQLANLNPAVLV